MSPINNAKCIREQKIPLLNAVNRFFLPRCKGARRIARPKTNSSRWYFWSDYYSQPHWVFSRWHHEHKMKFKECSLIKWGPPSIFFTRSVAFAVELIPLNKRIVCKLTQCDYSAAATFLPLCPNNDEDDDSFTLSRRMWASSKDPSLSFRWR